MWQLSVFLKLRWEEKLSDQSASTICKNNTKHFGRFSSLHDMKKTVSGFLRRVFTAASIRMSDTFGFIFSNIIIMNDISQFFLTFEVWQHRLKDQQIQSHAAAQTSLTSAGFALLCSELNTHQLIWGSNMQAATQHLQSHQHSTWHVDVPQHDGIYCSDQVRYSSYDVWRTFRPSGDFVSALDCLSCTHVGVTARISEAISSHACRDQAGSDGVSWRTEGTETELNWTEALPSFAFILSRRINDFIPVKTDITQPDPLCSYAESCISPQSLFRLQLLNLYLKTRHPSSLGDYCPISPLLFLSKLSEMEVFKRRTGFGDWPSFAVVRSSKLTFVQNGTCWSLEWSQIKCSQCECICPRSPWPQCCF